MNIEAIKKSLEDKREQLLRRVAQIESELRAPGSQDSQERAIEAENSEVLERLDDSERSELRNIERAVGRIDRGIYTVCSRCGGTIAGKRLEALPYTDTCVDCAG